MARLSSFPHLLPLIYKVLRTVILTFWTWKGCWTGLDGLSKAPWPLRGADRSPPQACLIAAPPPLSRSLREWRAFSLALLPQRVLLVVTSGGSFLLTVLTAFFFFSIIRGQWKLLFSERGRGNDLLSVAPSVGSVVWESWPLVLWLHCFTDTQNRRSHSSMQGWGADCWVWFIADLSAPCVVCGTYCALQRGLLNECAWFSWGCWSRVPWAGWLSTAVHSRSSGGQSLKRLAGPCQPETFRILPCRCPAPGGAWPSLATLACRCLAPVSVSPSHGLLPFVSGHISLFHEDTHWVSTHPQLIGPHLNLITCARLCCQIRPHF